MDIGGQYRGTFLVPVPSVLWKKVPVPQCTFISQFLGGTRYFGKIFCNKKEIIKKVKSAQLHLPQQSLERLVLKMQYCHPAKRGNDSFATEKHVLKPKRSGLSDDHL